MIGNMNFMLCDIDLMTADMNLMLGSIEPKRNV
jgi:hypothetical protein